MIILSVETSAVTCSAAIMRDGVITEKFINNGLTHSATLMPMISALLCETGISPSEIDRFAVAAGPGSFTGIRIGIATVKGLAAAGGRPCAGVSALAAMAATHADFSGSICCLMDARCGQFYNAIFSSSDGEISRLTPDRAVAGTELVQELEGCENELLLVGDGARKFADGFCDKLTRRFTVPEGDSIWQHASGVLLAAKDAEYVAPDRLLPVYLRLPQAERELKAKNAAKSAV